MSQRTWLCAVCTTKTADTFCCCGSSETFLCIQCYPAHFLKSPGRLHMNLPIGCYGGHKQPGFIERLQARVAELPGRTEALRQNLSKVEECRTLFTAKVEELIAKIRSEAQETLQELSNLREKLERDINTAVQEAESTIYSEEIPQISELGRLLRNPSIPIERHSLFTYQVKLDFSSPIRNFFLFTLQYPTFPTSSTLSIIAAIFGNQMKVHDLTTGQIIENRTLSRQFASGSVFCNVDNARMLCIGGLPYTKEVYWLNKSANSEITAAAEMVTARGWAGVVLVNKWVYVFGGNMPRIHESEKYSIESNSWKPILPMNLPKYAFSPCLYNSDIYLLELCQYKGAEKFSVISETYTQLAVALPTSLGNSLNVLVGKEMLFLSNDRQARRWNIDTGVVTSAAFSGNWSDPNLDSNIPPVCMDDKVYFVCVSTGKLITFNLSFSTLSYK